VSSLPELIGLSQLIAQADVQCLATGDFLSRVQQSHGVLLSDKRGQGDCQTEAMVETESGEVGHKSGLRARHSKIREEGQAESSSDGCSLNGRHDWRLGMEEPQCFTVQISTVDGLRGYKVDAGAEMLSAGDEHDRSGGRIGVGMLECVRQISEEVYVHKVVRWTVYFYGRHMVIPNI
jgi:hypothetical protein